MARSAECRCESNFTCGYCLRNAKPYFFTLDSGLAIYHIPFQGTKTGVNEMKQRHKAAARRDAQQILSACHIAIGQEFHTLFASQVESLLKFADMRRYQKPKHANGSRGRYFHDRLQRLATSRESDL